jgi:aldose 1-epimerase
VVAPSGEQYEISGSGYRAVVTESGGALRLLEHDGRALLDGFEESEMSYGGRGQQLVPWPNRIRDGIYEYGGSRFQLPLTEPGRRNASHGLARWVAWSVEEHTSHSVSLGYRLMAQTGYAWTLDLHVLYDLSADGLTVTQTVTNLADNSAPYAAGAHPYLSVGAGPCDSWELTLPAATRMLSDPERLLPTGVEDVEGTDYDFRVARPMRSVVMNHAFGDLTRDSSGRATTTLHDPATGRSVGLWVDAAYRWLMVYTADDITDKARRSVAVEPMTAPADAFRSGTDLVILAAAGEDGDEHSGSWGIRVLD